MKSILKVPSEELPPPAEFEQSEGDDADIIIQPDKLIRLGADQEQRQLQRRLHRV